MPLPKAFGHNAQVLDGKAVLCNQSTVLLKIALMNEEDLVVTA